jgi:hypothetical protein
MAVRNKDSVPWYHWFTRSIYNCNQKSQMQSNEPSTNCNGQIAIESIERKCSKCNILQWHAMTNGQWTSWGHQSPDRGAKMCETPSTRWLKAFLKIPKGTTWPAACAWVTWVWGVEDISKEFDVLFENKQWVLNGTCSVSVHHLWLTPHAKSNKSGISPVVRTMQYITRVPVRCWWHTPSTHSFPVLSFFDTVLIDAETTNPQGNKHRETAVKKCWILLRCYWWTGASEPIKCGVFKVATSRGHKCTSVGFF